MIEKIYKLMGSFYIESDKHEWGDGQYRTAVEGNTISCGE